MNLTTVHSLWLAPLCLLLGVGLAWFLYRRAEGAPGFSRQLSLFLAVLRALAVAFIAFFLLEPMVRRLVREVRKPVVVVAHDGSSSLLAAGDTSALRTTYKKGLERLAAELGDKYEVRTFTYGQHVREGLDFGQEDGLTDMGQLFREVYDRFSGPDLGAVVIDGDGIHNRGRDPRLEAARLGVPVFTIALGDTTVRPDLVLKAVEHNRINYLGNEFPLLVRIEARHLKGARSRVTVAHQGRELAAKDFTVTADPFFAEIPFSLKADRPGLQRFTVTVGTVAGESTDVNNSQDIFIDVLDDRQKVLLLGAAPHPDLGALRTALGGLIGYETELAFAADFTGPVEAYDLVVLHQLPSVRFPLRPLLERAALRGVPLLLVLGAGTDINAFNELGAGVRITGARGASTDAQAAVDREFSAFILEPEQVRAIERFPPLQAPFGQYEPGRAAMVLLRQRVGVVRTPYPLIALVPGADRRMGVVCGEGLWRWRLADMRQNGSHAHFDRLAHKLVQFLALKADKSRFRVDHAPEFAENDPVLITAELYNRAYEPVNTPEATVVLTDEEGSEFPYTFSRAGSTYRLDAGRLPAGRYAWQARTELDGERLTASGELLVRALVAELLTTSADHGLLADLAARSGGLMVPPDRMDEVVAAIRERREIAGRSYTHTGFDDLIGLRWPFFIILLLLTVEWAVRRRSGAY